MMSLHASALFRSGRYYLAAPSWKGFQFNSYMDWFETYFIH